VITIPQIIEVTAGEVTVELRRRGLSSDERVTVMIEPEQDLLPGRSESRAKVVAAGLMDADIDALIKRVGHPSLSQRNSSRWQTA
jgi:hypothetical protein